MPSSTGQDAFPDAAKHLIYLSLPQMRAAYEALFIRSFNLTHKPQEAREVMNEVIGALESLNKALRNFS